MPNISKIFIFLFLLTFISCSTSRPTGSTEAEVMYKEALELIEEERYLLATEKLNALRSQYPYSYYATHAELLQADVLFLQENYVEAAAAYILFRDFHPKHKKLSYVIWRIAQSYYNQLPSTFDRDLSAAHEAIKYLKEVLTLFPNSEYAPEARLKIKESQELLESKQRYIADFYFKTGDYQSARHRYIYIINNFSSEGLVNHSILRVLESSYRIGALDECKSYYNKYKEKLTENQSNLEKLYKKCQP